MNENNKKSAVILACGQGKRMEPLTFDTPKCFIKVDGECIIERNIKQLKEANIENIIVLTGYQKEKFEYLKDKYNVKLVYNKNYKIKNNLFSLLLAKEYVENENFYILVADNFLSENIFKEDEEKNILYVRKNVEKGFEWECIVDNDNKILSVDKHSTNDNVMTGIAYITKEMNEKLFKKAIEVSKKEESASLYWEDVISDDKDLLNEFYIKNVHDNSFYEFDTMEDLKRLTKHKVDYNSKAFKTIEKVFNIDKYDIVDIELMSLGLSNNLFSFSIKGKDEKYLFRVPGYGSEEFIDRKAEKDALLHLQKDSIVEYIHYIDEEGYKISTCYTDMRSVDPLNKEDVKRAMTAYKKLHNDKYVALSNTSFIEVVRKQIELSKKLDRDRYEDYDDYLKDEVRMSEYISKYKRKKYLCHGDGNPSNVLMNDEKVLLVDFEYVSMDDPIRDIAEFCLSAGYDDKESLEALHIYLEAEGNDVLTGDLDIKELEKLFLAYCVLAGIWGLVWCVVNDGLSSKDFTETFKLYEKVYIYNKRRLKEIW